MNVENFVKLLNSDFFTGVPDSQLRALCDFLIDKYSIDPNHHIIGANEGNCVALAAGYHLATGKIPVVYMQNSGIGNAINPIASLLNENVYAIPCIFVIGWRGEPGVHDEPQHVFQGQITITLLKDMDIEYFIIDGQTTEQDVQSVLEKWQGVLEKGMQVAFVVKKNALQYLHKHSYKNENSLLREEIIKHITKISGDDPIVSTTGKASRELFEIREQNCQSHKHDFLTVGSMGHCSSIAFAIAQRKPNKKVWCVDGDGAALMHLGALATIGANQPKNFVHIVINNSAHETVGGMPTVCSKIDLCKIATGCGYQLVERCLSYSELDHALEKARNFVGSVFIEALCGIGARDDLGRPTISAVQNKINFMKNLI